MSDIIQDTFEILKRNLELTDSYGKNPYLPQEKFSVLLKELQEHCANSFKLGERHGQLLALTKIDRAQSDFFFDAMVSADIKQDELQSTSQYLEWLKQNESKR